MLTALKNTTKSFLFLVLVSIIAIPIDATAQSESDQITSDRPFFTQSPFTVSKGNYQIEAGYGRVYLKYFSTKLTTHLFPDMLLRYGISDKVEIGIAWSYYRATINSGFSRHTTGTTDLIVSSKIRLTSDGAEFPNTSFVFNLKLPSGSSRYDDPSASFGLLYRFHSTSGTYLSGSTLLASESSRAVLFIVHQTFLLNVSLSDKVSIFVEPYVLYYVTGSGYQSQGDYFYNSGITYSKSDDVEFSLTFGQEIDSFFNSNYFASIGIAYRP